MKNIPERTLPVIPSFMNQARSEPEPQPDAPPKSRSSIKADKARERASMLRLAKVIGDLHMNASDPAAGEEEGKKNAALLGQTILRNLELIVLALQMAGGSAKGQ